MRLGFSTQKVQTLKENESARESIGTSKAAMKDDTKMLPVNVLNERE